MHYHCLAEISKAFLVKDAGMAALASPETCMFSINAVFTDVRVMSANVQPNHLQILAFELCGDEIDGPSSVLMIFQRNLEF